MLVSLDLSKIEKIDYMILPKKMSGKAVFDKYKPDYLLNATLYDVSSGKVITYSEDENKTEGYLFSKKGIGIKDRTIPMWVDINKAKVDDSIRDFIGGSPTLVVDNKVSIDSGGTNSWILNSSSYRSFLGFNDSKLFLGASDSTNTINSLASYCKSKGMKYAINLDGGGSCTLIEKTSSGGMKYLVNRESRANASWILVYLKKKGSDPVVSDDRKVVKPQKILANNVPLEGIVIDGKSYAPIREFEKVGAKVNYVDGIVYIDLPK